MAAPETCSTATDTKTSRRGRPPAGQATLSRRAIVDAAVQAIESEGLAKLSLRSVAARLGVDAKSLYNHIANKEALLDAVAGNVLSRIQMPAPTGELPADLKAMAYAFRTAALSSNREAAMLILSRPIEAMATAAPLDAVLRTLLDAGADMAWAVRAMRTTLAFMSGALLREVALAPELASDDAEVLRARQAALQSLGYAAVAQAAPYLSRVNHAQEFEFGIDTLCEAFARQLQGMATNGAPSGA
jgi:TetR/AcrR family tetracycline transcriptional repressor